MNLKPSPETAQQAGGNQILGRTVNPSLKAASLKFWSVMGVKSRLVIKVFSPASGNDSAKRAQGNKKGPKAQGSGRTVIRNRRKAQGTRK